MKPKVIILCVILIITMFCSCGKKANQAIADTTSTLPATQVSTTIETTVVQTTKQNDKKTTTPTQAVEETTQQTLEKTGDMIFTDSADNEYIKAISQSNNVSPEYLACLYTTTDDDRNYVWQFRNTRDESGRVIKNPDTLQYVYIVSHDCSSYKRTGGYVGNLNISPVEGYIVFEAAKQMQIPQQQQQLYS